MSTALVGAIIGLALGIASYAMLSVLAGRVDLAETRRVLKIAGMVELVIFPIVGWFAGAQFAGE